MRSRLHVALALLVVLTGCIGSTASPTSTQAPTDTASERGAQQRASASLWLSGTVASVEADSVTVEQGNDTDVSVTMTNHTDVHRCYRATTLNETTLACFYQFDVSDMQNIRGEEVCMSVGVENRSLHAEKAFFGAVCGGPSLPAESSPTQAPQRSASLSP